MTAADVCVPRARGMVVAGALVGCAALLWLTRTYTFYFDEWTFITTAPDWTFVTYFQPHNEHPSILFQLVYAALLNTVGLRSYTPYMAVLLLAHFASVVLLFELVRRRAGDLIAVACAALLLVLGAGWEDLLWAFQMAWLASVALGLGALLVLETRRSAALAAVMLTASLATSGIGVPFAVAATIQLTLTPARRREVLWLIPVGAAVLAWYVAFGRLGTHPNPQPTAANLLIDPAYVAWGLGQSAAGIIGGGGYAGLPLLIVPLAVIAWRWRRHGADPMALGVVVGLVAFYLIAGLTRAQLGWQQSGASRYVYIGAVLWLLLLADAAKDLPWRGTWRPALAACLFLACFNSGVLLIAFATARTAVMERQVADYYALAAERSDPCLDPHGAVDLLVMPVETKPALYYRAVDLFGDPSAGTPLRDRASYDAGIAHLRKASC